MLHLQVQTMDGPNVATQGFIAHNVASQSFSACLLGKCWYGCAVCMPAMIASSDMVPGAAFPFLSAWFCSMLF